jgi:hypothetical protein
MLSEENLQNMSNKQKMQNMQNMRNMPINMPQQYATKCANENAEFCKKYAIYMQNMKKKWKKIRK